MKVNYPLRVDETSGIVYAWFKGAIVSFTRTMALSLAEKGILPAYVYLASNDSAYVTGQILHVNGGLIRYS